MEIVIDRAAVLLVCQKAIIYLCLTKLFDHKTEVSEEFYPREMLRK